MANIGFTDKQLHIYARFQKMRRAYEDAHGRTYAPGFLTVLMDAFEVINQLNTAREKWVKNNPKDTASFVIEPGENGEVQFWRIEEDAYAQSRWTELFAPVSLRAYVADAEVNEQVIIKQSDGSQYLEKMLAHNHNAYLTPQRDEAMIFNNRDQAAAFLRKCGHEIRNWIIEPA